MSLFNQQQLSLNREPERRQEEAPGLSRALLRQTPRGSVATLLRGVAPGPHIVGYVSIKDDLA